MITLAEPATDVRAAPPVVARRPRQAPFLHRDPRSADPLVTDATPADMAVLESRMKLGLPMSGDGNWPPTGERATDPTDGIMTT